jgi:hypothetical protein
MNKWQVICPVATLLVAAIVFGSIHLRGQRRGLVAAATHQIDAHSGHIATLLTTMRSSNATDVADAAFQELQSRPYATSLISRSMIKVVSADDES